MKQIFILGFIGLLLGMGSCVKDNFVKSGLHNGRFNGSLLEYLKAPGHSYDWDSTARLVEQAGPEIVRLFEGKDIEHPEITFLGPTNHSIRRYMLENDIERIADIDPDDCKDLLLQCVIDGKIYRDSVPRGRYDEEEAMPGEGGKYYLTLGGSCLLYTSRRFREAGMWEAEKLDVDEDYQWQLLERRAVLRKRKRNIRRILTGVAAVVIMSVVASVYIYYRQEENLIKEISQISLDVYKRQLLC